ncbi:MAG TPA: HAD family hydrolase [Phototrophicaceae bacterium]|nr:HAD family hydrolase [Phototrophicaceae bacterium]
MFFEVPGVLVDRAALRRGYSRALGQMMAERYGLTPRDWTRAYAQVLTDWDSYYADLNLSGDDGLADLWEGLFRTTRALFRLSGVPEPAHTDLIALSRELPALASRDCHALYPEVADVLAQLDAAGLTLGVISYAISAQLAALLQPVIGHFKGAIWGTDTAERFEKDAQRYRLAALHAQVAPEQCLVVDDQALALANARKTGMRTVLLCRDNGDLRGLLIDALHQRRGGS